MDKDIFIVYLKADYIYKEDAETRFDTFQIINYKLYIIY